MFACAPESAEQVSAGGRVVQVHAAQLSGNTYVVDVTRGFTLADVRGAIRKELNTCLDVASLVYGTQAVTSASFGDLLQKALDESLKKIDLSLITKQRHPIDYVASEQPPFVFIKDDTRVRWVLPTALPGTGLPRSISLLNFKDNGVASDSPRTRQLTEDQIGILSVLSSDIDEKAEVNMNVMPFSTKLVLEISVQKDGARILVNYEAYKNDPSAVEYLAELRFNFLRRLIEFGPNRIQDRKRLRYSLTKCSRSKYSLAYGLFIRLFSPLPLAVQGAPGSR